MLVQHDFEQNNSRTNGNFAHRKNNIQALHSLSYIAVINVVPAKSFRLHYR